MLTQLPPILQYMVLALLGGVAGSAINWAIYHLAIIRKRQISPWQRGDQFRPTAIDRVPILGWLFLQAHKDVFGKGEWIRPMIIEIIWMIGLPLFWFWNISGGLTDGLIVPVVPAAWFEIWFWGHSVLLALLCVATFIDFDEKMIPDGVTVTGTLFALLLAALAPCFRLPVILSALVGKTATSMQFNSPHPLPDWHNGPIGLAIALSVFTVWVIALIPKLVPYEGKWLDRFNFTMASILRPPRKTNPKFGNVRRGPRKFTWFLLAVWAIGMIAITTMWATAAHTIRWDSLFGALIGLGFGGGVIWGIRIVGGLALNQEAMGFGDVTLMAMIGCFLGWQAALLCFPPAFFAALAFALVNLLINRENELAFGPYLCFGAVVTMFFWPAMWDYGKQSVFAIGSLYMVGVMGGAALAMYPLLIAVRAIRNAFFPFDEEEES